MTYKEAEDKLLEVKWKVSNCTEGDKCWCAIIEPENPVLFQNSICEEEMIICGSGAIHRKLAEHIVNIHNNYLIKKNYFITDKQVEDYTNHCIKETQLGNSELSEMYINQGLTIV